MYNVAMDRKSNYVKIGQRLREAREAKGWTQGQLGEMLKPSVTATAISLYEQGEREVPVDVLTKIASLADVPVEYLAIGKEPESHDSIQVALRADKDLWKNEKARSQVIDFIEFIKKKSGEENK